MIEEELVRLGLGDVDGGPHDVLRLSMLDWLACGIAGRGEPVSRVAMAAVEGQGRCATFLGPPFGTRAAAFVNGTAAHALDYDDTHFAHVGHPSVAVMPAALAVAEDVGASARELRDAALAGTEASVRFGVWLGRRHYEAGFHQTATAGAIGATLACARLRQLSPDRTRHAIGIASTMASGLRSQFGTMGKPLNAGHAAAVGVDAARLAEAGIISNPDALSGPQGFGPSHHGEANPVPPDVWLMSTVSHKLHACCHGLHAMLEALRGRRMPDGFVTVHTNPRWLTVCDKPAPRTGLEAKFSYRLTAAMALSGRDTGALGTFSDAACADPELLALRDRVRVVGDASLTDTQVLIEFGDEILQYDVAREIPLDERATRVRAKAAGLIGAETADRLWKATGQEYLGDLTDALQDAVS